MPMEMVHLSITILKVSSVLFEYSFRFVNIPSYGNTEIYLAGVCK
jgi:hypothetical protein